MENQRKPFKDFGEFEHSDFDDAIRVLLSKRKALCEALRVINGFAGDMGVYCSIIKDGVDKLDYQIIDYHFSDPTSIELIIEICNYNGAVTHGSTNDMLNFANHLINLGYDFKKKNKD